MASSATIGTSISRRQTGTLSKYDPQKGVKAIDFLAMAEKHFAKAKDATQLQKAIRAKLEAQAEFVFWWDTQAEKAQGRRSDLKHRNRPVTMFQAGENGLPDRMTISRWRAKLNDPAKFEATYETICAKYPKLLEFATLAHVGQNTGDTEWFTPPEIVEAARRVLGEIDLDPASTREANIVIKAKVFYTRHDDGLTKPWKGRVWMNPPYAHPLVEHFVDKLAASVRAGAVPAAIALVNNATETAWFRVLSNVASAVCFPAGRVKFWHPQKETAAPLQGQAVLYLGGPKTDQFADAYGAIGEVWVKPV